MNTYTKKLIQARSVLLEQGILEVAEHKHLGQYTILLMNEEYSTYCSQFPQFVEKIGLRQALIAYANAAVKDEPSTDEKDNRLQLLDAVTAYMDANSFPWDSETKGTEAIKLISHSLNLWNNEKNDLETSRQKQLLQKNIAEAIQMFRDVMKNTISQETLDKLIDKNEEQFSLTQSQT